MADMKVVASRIFIGSEISDLNFHLNFNGTDAQIELSAVYDVDKKLDLAGSLFINDGYVDVLFERLLLKYYEFDLANSGDIKFSYSDDKINFDSFTLVHNGGKLDLNGQLSFTGDEDLTLKLSSFKLKDLNTNLLGLSPERFFDGEINLDFMLTGSAKDPVMNLSYSIDSIKVQNFNLGSIESDVQYSDKLLNVDLSFLETKNSQARSSLTFEGMLPIDLAFYSEERLIPGKAIDMSLLADNFDLRFASGLIPGIKNLNGLLNGNINFSGPYNDLQNSGELTISNSSFILGAVNLTYLLDAKIKFENNKILISNLHLKNEPNIKNGGTMTAQGELVFQNFKIESINLNASGSLKLLDERSRAINPALFGDITVKTRNEIVFTSSENRNYLNADLILARGANITYSPAQSAFANESDKFTYIFVSPLVEDVIRKEIDSLIQIAEFKNEEKKAETTIPFDLDLKIEVESEAKVVFVLSREFKQNLTAYLGGNFEYTVVNDVSSTRGELVLLDGSKLDFIKTFRAEGNLKFLDELDNPYVNVTATYESFYSPDTVRTGSNEWDVQIIIKVEGPAKSITTNFLQDESNVSVYKSRRNANQFELDATKTASDAMFFIIVNKFPEDASLQESNFAASTAASLAGSIVGNVLNEKLGDVVRSVNVQQVGTETKFSLIGKIENFRYEIGGTSQVFQDLSRANVRIEHPLFFPNFIIRFDRKEPPYQSSTYSEMVNELGLKYSFVF
jgi:TamB, inner membrane protein subunit of TAM complex